MNLCVSHGLGFVPPYSKWSTGNTRCHPKSGLKLGLWALLRCLWLGVSTDCTVLPRGFVWDALCVVLWDVWDVVTAAAQAVNEVWEPEAHSQLEKGEKVLGHWQVLLSLILGFLPLSCFLVLWAAPGPCSLWMKSVHAFVFVCSLLEAGGYCQAWPCQHRILDLSVSLPSRSLGKPGNTFLEWNDAWLLAVLFFLIWTHLVSIGKNSFSSLEHT